MGDVLACIEQLALAADACRLGASRGDGFQFGQHCAIHHAGMGDPEQMADQFPSPHGLREIERLDVAFGTEASSPSCPSIAYRLE